MPVHFSEKDGLALVYGLMRMAVAFGETHGLSAQAFRDAETTEDWLRGEL